MYRNAVELTAQLCGKYGLDPQAPGVVICHSEGYKLGIASNHADVMHWFPKHNKSMDTFRADVAKEMRGKIDMTKEEVQAMADEAVSAVVQAAKPKTYPPSQRSPNGHRGLWAGPRTPVSSRATVVASSTSPTRTSRPCPCWMRQGFWTKVHSSTYNAKGL